ncbi:PfaD family polyunsaturated fatty acid/polyketide biosynthesis protein [Saccharothrix texasensis]|uniref:PfaD family protein n=1 Tax=Saccharothrix texasensis TaxID=103734 RepID=A0A3N1GZS1_9PSEU|nr:PfaD family polyunsaturated fatty acid/polyketide biosynthesis protein [Saccharothrix texasensis]ROP35747.1 PfaD family protein [Saccharothrix texasensis]
MSVHPLTTRSAQQRAGPSGAARTVRWLPGDDPPVFDQAGLASLTQRAREELVVLDGGPESGTGLAIGGRLETGRADGYPVVGILPPLYPEFLGDSAFRAAHGTRFAYVAGEMANGIATTDMVVAMAEAGMLGVFGAAGLPTRAVAAAVDELSARLAGRANWAVNLIHSPAEPVAEEETARLLVAGGVPCVSASAYLDLTPAVVRCAVAGLRRDRTGEVVRARRVVAKLSRPEVAARFLAPAPRDLVRALVDRGQVTEEEAELAAHVPVADDVTVEADSGGHTDNRPMTALLPVVAAVRDAAVREHRYRSAVRIGAAGGLGTPEALAAAFAAGAAYVVTGSVNQCAVESGLSAEGKELLARADIADTAMAPSADMFELGVSLQVLRRGSLFASRARLLGRAYDEHPSLESLPVPLRDKLEREVFRTTVEEVWQQTRRFWLDRDPGQVERAERDSRHRMALVFRWYLGQSSRWAITGEHARRTDYQIWCGPAMGAFNRWAAGSFLDDPADRSVVQIARNLLEGAAVVTRVQQLRVCGLALPPDASVFRPRRLA